MKYRLLFFPLLFALASGLSVAASVGVPARVSGSPKAHVSLVDLPASDLYSIHGTFASQSAPQAVWSVLSDYQGLGGVIKGLLSSRVLKRDANEVLVEQVMEGHFFIFGRTLRLCLKVKEQAPRLMEFSEASGGPFRSYQGSWSITPTATGSKVDYTLDVSRGDLAPRFLERGLFEKNAADLLRDLSREVDRRAGLRGVAPRLALPGATPAVLETLGNGLRPATVKKAAYDIDHEAKRENHVKVWSHKVNEAANTSAVESGSVFYQGGSHEQECY